MHAPRNLAEQEVPKIGVAWEIQFWYHHNCHLQPKVLSALYESTNTSQDIKLYTVLGTIPKARFTNIIPHIWFTIACVATMNIYTLHYNKQLKTGITQGSITHWQKEQRILKTENWLRLRSHYSVTRMYNLHQEADKPVNISQLIT